MNYRAWLAGGIPQTACVAAYEPICAVSLADSYINRANPGTYNAAPGVAPTWAAETGWTFNGTTQYLTTGLVSALDWSLLVRFSGFTLDRSLVGAVSTAGGNKYSIGFDRGTANNGGNDFVAFYPVGVRGISKTLGYLDGVYANTIPVGNGATTLDIFMGARNLNGAANNFGVSSIQAVYFYNAPITPTQVRAVTDAMNMLPMRPQLPRFRSWLAGGAATQFRKAFGLRTGSRGVPE